MNLWNQLTSRLVALFRKRELDAEMDDEMRTHIEMRTHANIEAGMNPEEARFAALRQFGWTESIKEDCREQRGVTWLETLLQDVRYGARQLRKNPGFTAVAVLTLALGIGANTAIFSVIDAVLWKSIPVKNPDQLVALTAQGSEGRELTAFSYPLYRNLRDQAEVFSGMLAYVASSMNFSANGQTERVAGQFVSGNYFAVLGVQPDLGRLFSEVDDTTPGAHSVAVLSHGFWARSFGSDPAVIGKTVHLNGHPFMVVGISQARFYGVEVGSSPDVWVPTMMLPQLSEQAGVNELQLWNRFRFGIMARLKSGVTEQQARATTQVLYQRAFEDAAGLNAGLRSFLSDLRIQLQPASKGLSGLRRQFQQPLLILMGVVGLVLLIACTNIANLLLARAAARQTEIAVRQALGASRVRLIGQFLTESVLLSLLSALAGLVVAYWATNFLVSFLSQAGFVFELRPDFRVVGFTMGLAAMTAILFGMAPAFRATRLGLVPALKRGIPLVAGKSGSRIALRKTLVIAQVALTLLLLIGAGLFVRTLQNLNGLDLGFRADKVLLLSMNPGLNQYDPNQVANFYSDLLDRVRSLPGVETVSLADAPLLGGAWVDGLSVEGIEPAPGQDMSTTVKQVAPEFFATMSIPLLKGRDFAPPDETGSGKVVIINETLARDFFGTASPLGRRIGIGGIPGSEIIAVIKDTKYQSVREKPPRTAYLPFTQANGASAERTLHVKASGNPKTLITAIRREMRDLDPHLPIYDVRTVTELVEKTMSQERLIAAASSLFGLLALLLAAIGLYGVIAYGVARRTREIGIRMALGAPRTNVFWLIQRETVVLMMIGIGVGLPAALATMRLVRSRLFGLSAMDPLTISVAIGVLIAVALVAGYLPARRAGKVDPMEALRTE